MSLFSSPTLQTLHTQPFTLSPAFVWPPQMVVAATVVVATVLYVFMQVLGGEKKKKLPVTLQDPTVKYPLRLVDKQVERRMKVYLSCFKLLPSCLPSHFLSFFAALQVIWF